MREFDSFLPSLVVFPIFADKSFPVDGSTNLWLKSPLDVVPNFPDKPLAGDGSPNLWLKSPLNADPKFPDKSFSVDGSPNLWLKSSEISIFFTGTGWTIFG